MTTKSISTKPLINDLQSGAERACRLIFCDGGPIRLLSEPRIEDMQVNGKPIREPYLSFCKHMEDINCHVLLLGRRGSGMNLVKEWYVREHTINYFNFQNKEITHEDIIHLSTLKNTVSLLDGVDLNAAKKGQVLYELLSLLRESRRSQSRFILTARACPTPDWASQMGLILFFERLDKGEGCAVFPCSHE